MQKKVFGSFNRMQLCINLTSSRGVYLCCAYNKQFFVRFITNDSELYDAFHQRRDYQAHRDACRCLYRLAMAKRKSEAQ